LFRRGITAVSNCIMIDALMYGMIPSEKTAQCSSAPPAKILNRAATPPLADFAIELWNHSFKTCALTPGIVIAAPALTMTSIERVNRIRCRSSGILKILVNAEIMGRMLETRREQRLSHHSFRWLAVRFR